jgi:hypothetical protein
VNWIIRKTYSLRKDCILENYLSYYFLSLFYALFRCTCRLYPTLFPIFFVSSQSAAAFYQFWYCNRFAREKCLWFPYHFFNHYTKSQFAMFPCHWQSLEVTRYFATFIGCTLRYFRYLLLALNQIHIWTIDF